MSPNRGAQLMLGCIVLLLEGLGGCRGNMAKFADLEADIIYVQEPPAPTGCADGSAFKFVVRKGTTNVNRVLIDFMGGGACWAVAALNRSRFRCSRCPEPSRL